MVPRKVRLSGGGTRIVGDNWTMFRALFDLLSGEDPGERARRMHSAWLTRAIRHGGGQGLPRIPVRRVSEGGYGPLMATVKGREWAEQWWGDTLGQPELE